MMKHRGFLYMLWIMLCIPINMHAAMANYNHFPALKPSHILDEELSDISFAFSMRVLESDYNGPLIRLRRASDNAEKDFGWGDNDIVDVAAIDGWRNGSKVYIRTWYDQSGLHRDAEQPINGKQPQFFTDAQKPYFKGDGIDDYLTVDTQHGLQDVTHNGKEGTVLLINKATKVGQMNFGVLTDTCRWSSHINWSNNYAYFDPGSCCAQNARSFENSANEGQWSLYTFIRTASKIIMRNKGVDKLNTNLNLASCALDLDFAIGWATGNHADLTSSSSFLEFVMYDIDIPLRKYKKIENNAITFWSL